MDSQSIIISCCSIPVDSRFSLVSLSREIQHWFSVCFQKRKKKEKQRRERYDQQEDTKIGKCHKQQLRILNSTYYVLCYCKNLLQTTPLDSPSTETCLLQRSAFSGLHHALTVPNWNHCSRLFRGQSSTSFVSICHLVHIHLLSQLEACLHHQSTHDELQNHSKAKHHSPLPLNLGSIS